MDHAGDFARRERAHLLQRAVLPHVDHALGLIADRQPDLVDDSVAAAAAIRAFVGEPSHGNECHAAQVGTWLSDALGPQRVEPGMPRMTIDAVAYGAASFLSNCALFAWAGGRPVGWEADGAQSIAEEVAFLTQYRVRAQL